KLSTTCCRSTAVICSHTSKGGARGSSGSTDQGKGGMLTTPPSYRQILDPAPPPNPPQSRAYFGGTGSLPAPPTLDAAYATVREAALLEPRHREHVPPVEHETPLHAARQAIDVRRLIL